MDSREQKNDSFLFLALIVHNKSSCKACLDYIFQCGNYDLDLKATQHHSAYLVTEKTHILN